MNISICPLCALQMDSDPHHNCIRSLKAECEWLRRRFDLYQKLWVSSEAALQKARKDTARLDWLTVNSNDCFGELRSIEHGEVRYWYWGVDYDCSDAEYDTPRAAIDAAMNK